MSSIRIFILSALADRGPMHGHQLRRLADEEHVSEWADITVGGLYGALKRLAAESLITEDRVEQSGNYPQRKVWAVTDEGTRALASLRLRGLREVVFKPDPFDLALARLNPDHLDDLPAVVDARITRFQAMLAEHETHLAAVDRYLSRAERMSITHRVERLNAEVAWHRHLAGQVSDIIADERARREQTDH